MRIFVLAFLVSGLAFAETTEPVKVTTTKGEVVEVSPDQISAGWIELHKRRGVKADTIVVNGDKSVSIVEPKIAFAGQWAGIEPVDGYSFPASRGVCRLFGFSEAVYYESRNALFGETAVYVGPDAKSAAVVTYRPRPMTNVICR